MDDMSHVRVLWLGRGTVCRHVEVARDLGERCEFQESCGLPPRWGAGLHPGVRQIWIRIPAWSEPWDFGGPTALL